MITTYVSLINLADCDKGTRFFLQDGGYYYKTRTERDAWLGKEEVETNHAAFELVANSSPALIGFSNTAPQKTKSSVFGNSDFLLEYEATTCSLFMNIVYRLFPNYFHAVCKRKQSKFEKAMLHRTMIGVQFQ